MKIKAIINIRVSTRRISALLYSITRSNGAREISGERWVNGDVVARVIGSFGVAGAGVVEMVTLAIGGDDVGACE